MNNFLKRLNKSIKAIIQRLNFFDILTLLALFVVLFILLRNYWQKKVEWVNVRLSVENIDWWYRGSKPAYWYAKDLQQGDIAYDSFGNEVAEVVSIENFDLGEDGRAIYVNLKVRASFDPRRQQYLYEFKPLLVGSSAIFNFGQEQLRGLVLDLGEKHLASEYEEKQIRIRADLVLPELANRVQLGTKAYDASGRAIAEIIGVDNQVSRDYDFSDIRGQKILVYDPQYRLLIVDLKMKVLKAFDQYYSLDGKALKVGQLFDLNFADFVLTDVEILSLE